MQEEPSPEIFIVFPQLQLRKWQLTPQIAVTRGFLGIKLINQKLIK